jgi:hypothetical protein
MPSDLQELLARTAVDAEPIDTTALLGRVRRRRRARRALSTATGVGVLLVAALLALPALRGPVIEIIPADRPIEAGTDDRADRPGPPPSQTPAEAERDGVVPAIAELTVEERVDVLERIETGEGVWVRSRLSEEVRERARRDGCAIGAFDDPTSLDGRDAVCVDEYGEVLLLDAEEERVIRAYPLPGVPAQTLVISEEAVHCARQGDGGLPDSMLCRIDRATGAPLVRVFPVGADSPYGGRANRWVPPWWEVERPSSTQGFSELEVGPDGLRLGGERGALTADPVTLELRDTP